MSKNNSEDYLDELLNSVAQPSAKKSSATLSEFDVEELEGLSEYDVDEFLKEFEKDINSTLGSSIKNGGETNIQGRLNSSSKDYFSKDMGPSKVDLEAEQNSGVFSVPESEEQPASDIEEIQKEADYIEQIASEDEQEEIQEAKLIQEESDVIEEEEAATEEEAVTEQEEYEEVGEASTEDFKDSEDSDSISAIPDEEDSAENEAEEIQTETVEVKEMDDQDVIELLSNMTDDDDLAEIGEMLKKEENNEPIEDTLGEVGVEMDESEMASMIHEFSASPNADSPEVDSKEKKKKISLFAKIYKFFVGDDSEEENENIEEKPIDENSQILEEMNEEENAGKKKKEKKPKKVKEPKQPKAPKEKKPKPPKAPKEPSNLKPLPKKPIILIAVMCLSLVVLVMISVNSLNYKTSISMSKAKYNAGNYMEAYSDLVGVNLSKSDEEYFMQAKVLSILQKELDSYETFYSTKMYNEALDSLIKGVERFDKNSSKAEELKVSDRMQMLETEIENQLQLRFGISPEKARELYDISNQLQYSNEIYKIVTESGLTEGK